MTYEMTPKEREAYGKVKRLGRARAVEVSGLKRASDNPAAYAESNKRLNRLWRAGLLRKVRVGMSVWYSGREEGD